MIGMAMWIANIFAKAASVMPNAYAKDSKKMLYINLRKNGTTV